MEMINIFQQEVKMGKIFQSKNKEFCPLKCTGGGNQIIGIQQ